LISRKDAKIAKLQRLTVFLAHPGGFAETFFYKQVKSNKIKNCLTFKMAYFSLSTYVGGNYPERQ